MDDKTFTFTRDQLIRLMGRAAMEAQGTSWGCISIAKEVMAEFEAEDGAVLQSVMNDDDTLLEAQGRD